MSRSRTARLPRSVVVAAWAVPLLVLGQFALVAVVPVTVLLVLATGRRDERAQLRRSSTIAMP